MSDIRDTHADEIYCVVTKTEGTYIIGKLKNEIDYIGGMIKLDNAALLRVTGTIVTVTPLNMIEGTAHVNVSQQLCYGKLASDLKEKYINFIAAKNTQLA